MTDSWSFGSPVSTDTEYQIWSYGTPYIYTEEPSILTGASGGIGIGGFMII